MMGRCDKRGKKLFSLSLLYKKRQMTCVIFFFKPGIRPHIFTFPVAHVHSAPYLIMLLAYVVKNRRKYCLIKNHSIKVFFLYYVTCKNYTA